MTQLTDKHWVVEVPDECTWPNVWNNQLCSGALVLFPIDPGDWVAPFSTKNCNEIDARKVVKELPVSARWMNYNGDYPVWHHTAIESLHSLLRSKGLDENKNYAIIETQTNERKPE